MEEDDEEVTIPLENVVDAMLGKNRRWACLGRKIWKNEFSVLEVVKTNLEVGKASNDTYGTRSSSLTQYFDTLAFAKSTKTSILTKTRDFKIWRKLENGIQIPRHAKTKNSNFDEKSKSYKNNQKIKICNPIFEFLRLFFYPHPLIKLLSTLTYGYIVVLNV